MRNYNSVGCNYLSQISACQMTLSRKLRAITELRVSSPRRVRGAQLLWGEQTIWSLSVTWGHLSRDKGPQMFKTYKAWSIRVFISVQALIPITEIMNVYMEKVEIGQLRTKKRQLLKQRKEWFISDIAWCTMIDMLLKVQWVMGVM